MTDDPATRTVREERSLSPMRETIASRLQESYREAVHVTVSRDVDADLLLAAAEAAGPVDSGSGTVDPSMLDVLLCALSETLDTHPSFNATFEDGTHRIYEQHNVGVAVDITDLKEHEEELRRQNERLDEFANVVSHDLRNPLGIAQGYLELVRETGDDEAFAKIEAAHQRMEAIIDDVLTLARHGRWIGETQPVSLPSTIEAAWGAVETDGAELTNGEDLGTIDADDGRLEALFENLFRNAIEHGGEDVTVRVGRSPTGFFIEDDGPGILESEREQVFERGHTTSESGTGFGLSIVEQIADAHGWDVMIGEGADGGARFEIEV